MRGAQNASVMSPLGSGSASLYLRPGPAPTPQADTSTLQRIGDFHFTLTMVSLPVDHCIFQVYAKTDGPDCSPQRGMRHSAARQCSRLGSEGRGGLFRQPLGGSPAPASSRVGGSSPFRNRRPAGAESGVRQ